MNIQWGVPTQRQKKTEKYDFPVITLEAITKQGANRKFSLNSAAMEALGLVGGESKVAIGFADSGDDTRILIAKKEEGFLIGKNSAFSDKRTYEYIAKIRNLDISKEHEFSVNLVDGKSFYELTLISNIENENLSFISEEQDLTENVEITETFNTPMYSTEDVEEVEVEVEGEPTTVEDKFHSEWD